MSATDAEPQTTLKSETGTTKGHPKGLYFLFFTEMWERLSYYGMRVLLMPYMVTYLLWQPSDASGVYKWYTSLVYLTPLLGGYLADRFLGLRSSIIIGGTLMAIGHFLMAFESLFFPALAFLIAGNGFFKPNISTMVGKMYKQGDARRDGAFTIFYMGINLGAFLAPLVCDTLRKTLGFHYGFAAAGVGMVIGLVTFVFVGQKRVLADVAAAGNELALGAPGKGEAKKPDPKDDADEREPGERGAAGVLSNAWPFVMMVAAVAIPGWYIHLYLKKEVGFVGIVMPIAFGCIFAWMATTLRRIKGASKDKSIVIFVLFCFAVLFWMAFEQAGNALNLWAFMQTDLHLGAWEYPAGWFQSANAILIVALAPLFAIMWRRLAAAGKEPATPFKMLIALVFMALSFLAMVGAAIAENGTVSSVALSEVPAGVDVSRLHAGRMTFDPAAKELRVRGVLPIFAVSDALTRSADPAYVAALDALEKQAKPADDKKPVTATLDKLPDGFVFPLDDDEAKKIGVVVARDIGEARGKKLEVAWTKDKATFKFLAPMDGQTKLNLIGAGAPPSWREPIRQLEKKSQAAKVSGLWLWLSYLLATLGELCLSPVGLSMVTKLAPARFASLFMGVWMLASSVAQYVGGSIGESWGKVTPTDYFWLFVWTSLAGVAVLAVLATPLRKLMHKVR